MNFFFLAGIGLLVGFAGTVMGSGGGFILVPVLLLLMPASQPQIVTSISLAIVFLNASSGSIAYARLRRIDYKSAAMFAVASLPGAAIGASMTTRVPRTFFDLLLGSILVIIAVFLLIRPEYAKTANQRRNLRRVQRSFVDRDGQHYAYSFNRWVAIILSFVTGYLSSFLGIGGGIFHVTLLTSLLDFPIHVATATSHLILATISLAGTIVHLFQGNLEGQWYVVFTIGAGAIIGAQVGAYLSNRIRALWVIRALAVALLLIGIRIMVTI